MHRPCLTLSLLLVVSTIEAPSAGAADLERWLNCSQNLCVDANLDKLGGLLGRAAKSGYTHVLLSDSKFAKLGDRCGTIRRTLGRKLRS
jgi:hypothetical protein